MKLILLGPPGSGKGTQAKKIEFQYILMSDATENAEHFPSNVRNASHSVVANEYTRNIRERSERIYEESPKAIPKYRRRRFRSKTKHLAAGDLLREEIAMKSEIGKKVESYVKGGKLAPDKLIIELMKKSIQKCENFILDGFPRNITQAKALEKISDIDLVLNVAVDEKIIVKRLSGRRTCSTCNAIYHLSMNPPKKEDICDRCGGKLFQRDDDKEAVIKKRLVVYKKETKPLIEYYKRSGKLETINGNGSVDEVFNEISCVLNSLF